MKTTVSFMGVGIELELAYKHKYRNGRTAIEATSVEEGKPFGVLTVNVEAVPLADDEIIVKTYSENEEWAPQVLASFPESFIDTGRTVQTGWVTCPVYRFVPPTEVTPSRMVRVMKRMYAYGVVEVPNATPEEALEIVDRKIANRELQEGDVDWGDPIYETGTFDTIGEVDGDEV